MKYFTYLWINKTWERKASLAASGYPELDYAASSKFSSSGVNDNSTVFLITVKEGKLFLGGRIVVSSIVNKSDAAIQLGQNEEDLWQADEYILADSSTITSFNSSLQVSDAVAHSLEFATASGGFKNLKIDAGGKINQQTLRNVRELYRGEHKKLTILL